MNDLGNEIGKYETLDEALYFAALNGVSPKVITDDDIFELHYNMPKNEYKEGFVFGANK